MNLFKERRIAIATMHGKEVLIAPFLKQALKANPFLVEFDTDQYGTFTGEVERKGNAYNAAKAKCLKAMELSGIDVAIASEGSFGPHPSIPFVSADDELVLLVDVKNNVEFFGREISVDTNFNAQTITTMEGVDDFCLKVGFPDHALIVKDKPSGFERVWKGVCNRNELEEISRRLLKENGELSLETDMRAMYNPKRREVIRKATAQLISKLQNCCPMCEFPGFWISDHIAGLPCSLCGFPTKSTKAHKYECIKCAYEEMKEFPYLKKEEDPMYCDMCNP